MGTHVGELCALVHRHLVHERARSLGGQNRLHVRHLLAAEERLGRARRRRHGLEEGREGQRKWGDSATGSVAEGGQGCRFRDSGGGRILKGGGSLPGNSNFIRGAQLTTSTFSSERRNFLSPLQLW
jgi:hypothetical protein